MAAFATRGLCADVVRTVLVEHELVVSNTVLEELTRTLIEKVRLPETAVREITTFLRASASVAEVASLPVPVAIRDPDDAVILGEALASSAEVLVTGDKDLLEAGELSGIRILEPRAFWQLVRGPRA